MLEVLFSCETEDNHIIQLGKTYCPTELCQHQLHEPLNLTGGITKLKGHHSELEEPTLSSEDCLLLVGWIQFNVPVATSEV